MPVKRFLECRLLTIAAIDVPPWNGRNVKASSFQALQPEMNQRQLAGSAIATLNDRGRVRADRRILTHERTRLSARRPHPPGSSKGAHEGRPRDAEISAHRRFTAAGCQCLDNRFHLLRIDRWRSPALASSALGRGKAGHHSLTCQSSLVLCQGTEQGEQQLTVGGGRVHRHPLRSTRHAADPPIDDHRRTPHACSELPERASRRIRDPGPASPSIIQAAANVAAVSR